MARLLVTQSLLLQIARVTALYFLPMTLFQTHGFLKLIPHYVLPVLPESEKGAPHNIHRQ